MQVEGGGDSALLGVLRPGRGPQDGVLCPVRPRRRALGARGELPHGRQTRHRGSLSGSRVHLQVGGERMEPGTPLDRMVLLLGARGVMGQQVRDREEDKTKDLQPGTGR